MRRQLPRYLGRCFVDRTMRRLESEDGNLRQEFVFPTAGSVRRGEGEVNMGPAGMGYKTFRPGRGVQWSIVCRGRRFRTSHEFCFKENHLHGLVRAYSGERFGLE